MTISKNLIKEKMDRNIKICNEWVSGETKSKISKNFKLSYPTVTRIIEEGIAANRISKDERVKKAMSKGLTPREESILSHRKSGLTLQEIGDIHDITRERTRQILGHIKKKGFDAPRKSGDIKKAIAAKKNQLVVDNYIKTNSTNFIKEYKKNLSDKDTANSLDLSLNNFKSIAETLISKGKLNRRLKIFDEKKFLNMQKEWEEIFEMRKAGYSNKKIASILGTSSQMISIKVERMKSNGYSIRPYGLMAERDYSSEHDQETLLYRTKAIQDLNNQGLAKSQIAKKLGIGLRDLYRHIDLYMINY